MRGITKFKVLKSFAVNDVLLLPDDIIYVEHSDTVAGKKQNVYNADRVNIACITSSTYWDLRKTDYAYIEEIKQNP